jgi:hypothetical protein
MAITYNIPLTLEEASMVLVQIDNKLDELDRAIKNDPMSSPNYSRRAMKFEVIRKKICHETGISVERVR